MKKSNSGCKTSILLFLIGVLIFFLALGSMKEGQTNTCPSDYFISKNDPNRCCYKKQNWYISKNNNDKCCANKGINTYKYNNITYCGTQKKTVAVDAKATTTSTPPTVPPPPPTVPPPPPTNQATLDLFNQFDSNRDSYLSEIELYNLINNKFPHETCDDKCFYDKADAFIPLDTNGDLMFSYDDIKNKLVDYL